MIKILTWKKLVCESKSFKNTFFSRTQDLLLYLVYLADSSNMQQQSSIHKYDSTMMTIKDHVHCQARHPWNINSDLFLIISFRKYPVSEIPNKGPKFLHEISRIFKYILHNSFTWKWIPIFWKLIAQNCIIFTPYELQNGSYFIPTISKWNVGIEITVELWSYPVISPLNICLHSRNKRV